MGLGRMPMRCAALLPALVALTACATQTASPRPTAQASAAPNAAEQGDRPSATRGAAYARQVCSACHAVQGAGVSPNPAAPPFATLAGRYPGVALERKLAEIAETGHYRMPPLQPDSQTIEDLAAYLDALETP